MNKETYEAAVARLREVNTVIKSLDEAIRAEAFSVLRPYIDGKPSSKKVDGESGRGGSTDEESVDTGDLAAFFSGLEINKPSEAAYAVAAWWFSQYGSAPIGRDDIDRIAGEVGITVPERPDMTIAGAKVDGKALFRKTGRGAYSPTVHGELHFKTSYKVTKGKKQPPAADES